MKVFDLHCDTATALYRKNLSLDNRETHINKTTLQNTEATLCCAVFFNDEHPNPYPEEFWEGVTDKVEEMDCPGLTTLLTAEGVGVLACKESWIDLLSARNCRMAGLVWNGKNPLATGAKTDDTAPLTPQGREAVKELIARGIAVDVSHLSAAGTEEILHLTDAPIVASHSNAKGVKNHFRNLSDGVAREIFRRGGLVGLNFCPAFLGEGTVTGEDILRHADYLLNLGGEQGLALGADWDGAPLPEGMKDFSSLFPLYGRFCSAFGEELTRRIFYENAAAFFASFQGKGR